MIKKAFFLYFIILIFINIAFFQIGCANTSKRTSATTQPERIEIEDSESPFLKSPKVKKYWQQDKVEGKRFIKGHWVYEIEEQSVWIQ